MWFRACCLLVAALPACSAQRWARSHADTSGKPPPVSFLERRPAHFADARAELGAPYREFRRDQVAMWQLTGDGDRCVPAGRSESANQLAQYLLVIEFDAQQQVVRWSLLVRSVAR